ncbi:MAG: zinc ribbon domain-containing protein [Deltaproteobacteria bacterium]|nr:zinc ribbon domain-containing protein [Deltaproteobacteria bacterium]
MAEKDDRDEPEEKAKRPRSKDDSKDDGSSDAVRDLKAELDERRIARGLALGLPLATLTLGLTAGAIVGPAMAILVFAAGVLLGVIALFWASLRVLSGDAALPPEIAMLDASGQAVDVLASRKKMLLRAIKDLEVEHSLGKLDDDDRSQIARMYREELKDVMRRIDASLEPHRPKAEELVRAHLARVGLAGGEGYRGKTPEEMVEKDVSAKEVTTPSKVECPKCATRNDPDAAFCKKCGAALGKTARDDDGDDDDDERDDDVDDDVAASGTKADAKSDAKADVTTKETADDAQ